MRECKPGHVPMSLGSHDAASGRVESDTLGAFGFALPGLRDRWLGPAQAAWPCVEIREIDAPPCHDARPIRTDTSAAWTSPDGNRFELHRPTGSVEIRGPRPFPQQALVHPWLGMICAVWAHWLGRPAFHAGAFCHGGRAFAVVGDTGAGKSTFIAAVAARGYDVFCDDTLILDDGRCLSGPRCVDLRGDTAQRLGLEVETVPLPATGRQRVGLSAAPDPTDLGGWLYLRWSDGIGVRRMPAQERLARLGAVRGWHRAGTRSAATLLDLAALPAWEVSRPRDWGSVDHVLDEVLEELAVVG